MSEVNECLRRARKIVRVQERRLRLLDEILATLSLLRTRAWLLNVPDGAYNKVMFQIWDRWEVLDKVDRELLNPVDATVTDLEPGPLQ